MYRGKTIIGMALATGHKKEGIGNCNTVSSFENQHMMLPLTVVHLMLSNTKLVTELLHHTLLKFLLSLYTK